MHGTCFCNTFLWHNRHNSKPSEPSDENETWNFFKPIFFSFLLYSLTLSLLFFPLSFTSLFLSLPPSSFYSSFTASTSLKSLPRFHSQFSVHLPCLLFLHLISIHFIRSERSGIFFFFFPPPPG